MANMSYCRFQNTRPDLLDCVERLDDIGGDLSQLSEAEARAAEEIVELCKRVAHDYGEII